MNRVYEMGSVKCRFAGHVGDKIDQCIANGVMKTDYRSFVEVFREKTDSDGLFCGEFWGKWFTSAVLAYEYQKTEAHFQVLKDAAEGIMSVQEKNGRISCSGVDFSDWDLWGRKYVLLGLLAYYDVSGEERALLCAGRMTDNLIEITMKAGKKITDVGLELLQGVSSCSLLQPIVRLYQRTGEKRYLEFAEHLVSLWSQGGRYNKEGVRLLEGALSHMPPVSIAVPKAYEVMSCFEGVLELYLLTDRKEYLEAVQSYMDMVLKREIMITGTGSSGELWCDGAFRQTQVLETPMETCVTATFMKLCASMLCVTGDRRLADQLEISLYNALLGAMKKDGSWWAYFSPLLGQRVPSPIQIERVKSSCCVVNGPRALLEVPKWAVMKYENGIAINLYEDGEFEAPCNTGEFIFHIEGGYPKKRKVRILLHHVPDGEWGVRFRIPSYSRSTGVWLNGEKISCNAGTYCEVCRSWSEGDLIEMEFDMDARIVTAPGNVSFKAVTVGPVVLAMDSRRTAPSWKSLRLMNDAMKWKVDGQTQIRYMLSQSLEEESDRALACEADCPDAYMAYRVRFLYKPIHFFQHEEEELLLCDYASCGSSFEGEECIRVWMPQPMFMPAAFPEGTKCIIAGIPGEDKGDGTNHWEAIE